MVDKKLINILDNIFILLELKGENPFKARAYSNAAQIIMEQNLDIEKSVREGTLAEIKGFGEALQKKVTEYVETGKMPYYEKLKSEMPESLIEITKLSNIGTRKTKVLYEKLNITTIDELEIACKENRLSEIKVFGEKSQAGILESIAKRKATN
jgi:DNA polymerase (family X)